MGSRRIAVLVVDDNEDVAGSLALLIDREADMECVGTVQSADGLIAAIKHWCPNIVLLDLSMPGTPPLMGMAQAIKIYPDVRFVVLSGYDDPETQDAAIDGGAWGFVSKHESGPVVLAAIRAVVAGKIVMRGK